MTKPVVISKRYDFVLLFDVKDGNPNGDPDADNMPRFDPETLQGLVTDVCLKRKIRNYVQITKHTDLPETSSKNTSYKGDPYDIFIREGKVLNNLIDEASKQTPDIVEGHKQAGVLFEGVTPSSNEVESKKNQNKKKNEVETRDNLCSRYYDVRTFGAVASTNGPLKGKAEGQIRGPVQLTFARSIDPVITLGHSITRCAVTDEKDLKKERTMGRKHTISYGLYKAYGFVSPNFAEKTNFSEKDLEILWEALLNMFDFDHSAARGLMTTRSLIVFEHDDKYGNTQASKLFDMVKVRKLEDSPARSFEDYEVTFNGAPVTKDFEIINVKQLLQSIQ